MSLTDPTPKYCDYCGSKFRERYPGQRYCRPHCRNAGKAAEGRSARRVWNDVGRPVFDDRPEPKPIAEFRRV